MIKKIKTLSLFQWSNVKQCRVSSVSQYNSDGKTVPLVVKRRPRRLA